MRRVPSRIISHVRIMCLAKFRIAHLTSGMRHAGVCACAMCACAICHVRLCDICAIWHVCLRHLCICVTCVHVCICTSCVHGVHATGTLFTQKCSRSRRDTLTLRSCRRSAGTLTQTQSLSRRYARERVCTWTSVRERVCVCVCLRVFKCVCVSVSVRVSLCEREHVCT
jgi:hypothetical protein